LNKREWIRDMAVQRIERLFELAEKWHSTHPERSNRCVALARRIAMKYRVRIPKNLRRRFCRKCNSYFIFGKNARVRLKKKRVVVECLNCGFKRRYPYDRK